MKDKQRMKPKCLSDDDQDEAYPRLRHSSQHDASGQERIPTVTHAYVGKPPPGAPARFIVGKRPPPPKRAKPRKRLRFPAYVTESDEESDSTQVSPSVAGPSRGLSPEIPFDYSINSNASSRTLVNGSSARQWSSLNRPKQLRRRCRKYCAPQYETAEDADLVICNETEPDSSDPQDIPVRLLRDFAIYEMETKRLVSFEGLQVDMVRDVPRYKYGASGFVEAFIDEDEGTDDEVDDSDSDSDSMDDNAPSSAEPPLRIALSSLKRISVHHVDTNEGREFKLNKRVYLETAVAWYILVEPNSQYVDLYAPFHIQHGLFHELIISSLAAFAQEQDLSIEDFKQAVNTMEMTVSQPELLITSDYLDCAKVICYIAHAFQNLCEDHEEIIDPLKKISALATLWKAAWSLPNTPNTISRPTISAVQKDAIEYSNKTIVTPTVYRLCEGLFPQKHLQRVTLGEDAVALTVPKPSESCPQHDAQMRCQWVKESRISPHHYKSVLIDGIQYNVGDTVLVVRGKDANSRREKHAKALDTGDMLSDKYWFAKICFMYEQQKAVKLIDGSIRHTQEKYFHGQWYYHGSKSLLHEMTHPRGLFPTNECDNNSLYSIVQKLNVDELAIGFGEETSDDGKFYSGLLWDQTRVAFCEMQPEETQAAMDACQPGEECVSCGLRQIRFEQEMWHVGAGCLSRGGVDFHMHDFVYLRPDTDHPSLYIIGQIVEVVQAKPREPHSVKARMYERYDSVANKDDTYQGKKDERCLIWTDLIRDFDISCIEGKAYAVHPKSLEQEDLENWVKHDDHFLVEWRTTVRSPKRISELHQLQRNDFRCCHPCRVKRNVTLSEEEVLLSEHGPLRCMELFAGAGGLATGLYQSGFVETKWAIELASSAALSFATNNPDCTVYNQCTNVMLRHAVDTHYNRKPKPVFSRNRLERDPLPPMPKPGEVDFISGGPPCQSFSGANHCKRADDIRTTLICNMLSYVEFYRPKYFLLENVVGLLCYHTLGNGDVKMGMVKFITRTLIALGYQVHCKVLQAAHYGAPQGRERAIFWGARRDVPLPDFPFPTHHSSREGKSYKLPTGEILHRPVRLRPPSSLIDEDSQYRQYAPFHAVTVQDAIGDLRKFDWIVPRIILEARKEDFSEMRKRHKLGIRSYPAIVNRGVGASYSGYVNEESYLHNPQNRYQMQVRQGLELNAGVRYHYTNRFSAMIVERVVNVPLKPKMNHTNLPVGLRDARKYEDGRAKKQYALHFGRLDAHSQFRTTMTTVKPNSMNGCVLHPTQKRVLTVRECARAQGFPDSYVLESTQNVPAKIVEDQLKQIGNAVPIPLALALGKELGKALIQMWKQEEQKRGDSPEVPMEVDDD